MASSYQAYNKASFDLYVKLQKAAKTLDQNNIATVLGEWNPEANGIYPGDNNIVIVYMSAEKDQRNNSVLTTVFDIEAATDVDKEYKRRDISIRYEKNEETVKLIFRTKQDTLWVAKALSNKAKNNSFVVEPALQRKVLDTLLQGKYITIEYMVLDLLSQNIVSDIITATRIVATLIHRQDLQDRFITWDDMVHKPIDALLYLDSIGTDGEIKPNGTNDAIISKNPYAKNINETYKLRIGKGEWKIWLVSPYTLLYILRQVRKRQE